ncbi:MDR family MFS transporter [Streptomyces uncialis]|uniref:MDR family MFS transporter n=1 Tax=Streptomyces uncialis TaxID=1048205 RepID=UPI0038162EB6
MSDPSPAAGRTGTSPSRLTLLGLLLGVVLATLDGTITATALPVIVGDLGGVDQLSWVVTAYLLASSVATPLWGKAGDLYGRKGAYLVSIGVFLAGSVLCGLARDMGQLIAFRTLQGLGAGGMFVGSLALIGTLLPPRESGRAQAMIGAVLPAAFLGGPLVGGFLTDQLSWRWTFYVNVPLGALAVLIVVARVRLRQPRIKAPVDLLGAALLTTGILAVTLLATWAGTAYPWWSAPVAGLALLSAGSLYWFLRVERRVPEPVLPVRLFRDRGFATAQAISLLVGAAMLALSSYLPQYLQYARGASSTGSGLLLLPLSLGMIVVQLVTGRLISATGRYRIYPILGGAVVAAGALGLFVLVGTGTSTWVVTALSLVIGAGLGLLLQSTMVITMNSTGPRDLGAASGTVTLLRGIGGSLGVAVLGSAYAARVDGTLEERLGAAGGRLTDSSGQLAPDALAELPAAQADALREAVTGGLHAVALGALLLGALSFALAWLIREVPLRTRSAEEELAGDGTGGGPDGAGDGAGDDGEDGTGDGPGVSPSPAGSRDRPAGVPPASRPGPAAP